LYDDLDPGDGDVDTAAKFPAALMTVTDLRAGETTVALGPASDAALRFIGTIRTPWADRADCPRQGRQDGPDCRIELDPIWQDALEGLAAYETVEVLYWLDRSRCDLTRQSPRGDGRTVGTFALRSPVRPNPIGTALVRLLRIEGGTLHVPGLDCLDGTPLIDLKPDRRAFTPKAPPKPGDADRA
jgi:tRNA-Thr(GGU) m(6)t(6)A37 methyltransferase TsaA